MGFGFLTCRYEMEYNICKDFFIRVYRNNPKNQVDMEKIFIKPDSKEIVLRGKPEDGHVDVFSYNYEPGTANGLGGLFIVGHVQPATEDTSYMINLVASLAKREYYAKPDMAPKESFSKTLKKINEVLQDFFRNKDIKVNVGIFAVAGENIFISRLGKFKIILGRDNQNVDILNNISLFNKEHIQEKEFSNIISGKIMPKDKIFAFYPGRSIVAREKNIKLDLLKLGSEDFAEKLNVIKKTNENFLCAGIHIEINKHVEPAIIDAPQPQELRSPKAVLAKISKAAKDKVIASIPDDQTVRPVEKSRITTLEKPPIKIEKTPPPQEEVQQQIVENAEGNVFYPGHNNLSMAGPQSKPIEESATFIRPSEFSTGKKDGFMSSMLRKYKPNGIYMIGSQPFMTKKKLITTVSLLAVIVLVVVAKYTFAPYLPIPVPGGASPAEKASEELIKQAEGGLESAKVQINQNNLLEARKILRTYYESLEAETHKTQHLNKAQGEILATLDELDKAVDSSPSLLQEVTQAPADEFQSWSLIWSMVKGELKIEKPDLAGIGFYPYQDNIYVLANDTIYKIADGLKGKKSAVGWLNKNVSLPTNPVSLAIDSKVFVINEGGTLTVYYRGDKVAEINTSIPVEKGSALLTAANSANLYLIDKSFGRIYIIAKETGILEKTLKLNSQEPIIDASITDDGMLYILSKDNKVWKITP